MPPADANLEVLRRLKDMGLVRVFLGIESATAEGLAALHRRQSVEESERALEACAELDISAQFTIMTFHPAATLDTLRSDVTFMRRFCGNPLNFCRAEIYAGTPLEKQMIQLGRARGDYLARVYSLSDPVADLACNLSLDLFASRCWSNGSLMQRTIGLDHMVSVVKRFHDWPRQRALAKRAAGWVRSVNLDTINLLEEVVELSSGAAGGWAAGLEKALRDVRKRESRTRQKFLREGMKLRAELEDFRYRDKVPESSLIFSSSHRLARQAAAALLVLGIPAVAGCNRSQDQELKTPAPPPAPPSPAPASHPYYGISEMAPPPLLGGKALPPGSTPGPKNLSCSLTGTVADVSGAVIPNATITITNLDTKLTLTFKTNNAGEYLATLLPPGRYTVKVQATGFKTVLEEGIVLKEGASERANFNLKLMQSYTGCCEFAPGPLEPPVIQEPKIDLSPLEMGNPADKTPPPMPGQPPQTPPQKAPAGQTDAKCSLMGTVTDSSGAIVPKAVVTITNLDSGKVITLTASETGQYVANDLPDGRYMVKAVAAGFAAILNTEIVLHAGSKECIDLVTAAADFGISEYAAVPLKTVAPEDLTLKKKPFTYYVGDAKDHNTLQGIAKLVYGDSNGWVAIFEANRDKIEKPGFIPNGTEILIPKERRDVPKLISKVAPVYPPEARKANVWGDVVMDITLKEDGSVEQVAVVDGNPLLVEAATTAVKQWRYRMSAGKTQPTKFVVVVTFKKDGKVR